MSFCWPQLWGFSLGRSNLWRKWSMAGSKMQIGLDVVNPNGVGNWLLDLFFCILEIMVPMFFFPDVVFPPIDVSSRVLVQDPQFRSGLDVVSFEVREIFTHDSWHEDGLYIRSGKWCNIYNIYIWIYREILFETSNYVRSYTKTCCFFSVAHGQAAQGAWIWRSATHFFDGDPKSRPKLSCMKPLTHIEGTLW